MNNFFRHSLLSCVCASALAFLPSVAYSQDAEPTTPAPKKNYAPWERPTGLAAGSQYFGYSWPFEGRDLNKEIFPDKSSKPVLLEMITDPGCMFCPPADQFLNDLVKNTDVIVLACHAQLIPYEMDDPLVTQQCVERQMFYSAMLREPRMSPQIFLNGKKPLKGFLYKDVVKHIINSDDTRPDRLAIISDPSDKDGTLHYHIDLPQTTFDKVIGFNDHAVVQLIEYKKPITTTITAGPNEGVHAEYYNVVSKFILLDSWYGEAGAYHFSWTPSTDAAGAVLTIERKDTGLMFVGEIKRNQ